MNSSGEIPEGGNAESYVVAMEEYKQCLPNKHLEPVHLIYNINSGRFFVSKIFKAEHILNNYPTLKIIQ